MKVITPILGDRYYHVFNRGNNKRQVFFSEANYNYFLKLYDQYLGSYVSTLAYSLMPNHFHLLIKTRDKLPSDFSSGMSSFQRDDIPEEETMGKIISNQFHRFFIS